MTSIRNAVRVFVIDNNEVVCIRYNHFGHHIDNDEGLLDIPGGKIEDGETEFDACKRELKEETNLDLIEAKKIGILKIYYPHLDKIFVMNTYLALKVDGDLKSFEENDSLKMNINELLEIEKRFASTHLLDNNYIDEFNKNNFHIEVTCDKNHNIIDSKIL